MEKKFKCDLCGKCFANKSRVVNHIRTHTKEKPFACSTCDKRFARRSNLKIHTLIHSGEKPHACKLCDKKCTHKSQLAIHVSSVHYKERPFVCELCKKAFAVKSSLNTHIKCKHNPEKFKKTYTCDKCGRTFTKRYSLTVHLRLHADRITYGCRICKTEFLTKGDLIVHMGIHINPSSYLRNLHPNDEQVSSEVLNADLNGESYREQIHGIGKRCTVDMQNSDHVNNDREVNLELGSKSFESEKDEVYREINVKEHLVEEQPNNGVNGGTKCAVIDLEKNMQIIAPVNYHTCEICNKCLSDERSFLKHKRTHMREKPFKCETCNKPFFEKGELIRHMIIHKEVKQFVCHVCSKGFTSKSALRKHIRVHTQERPYKCLVCCKSFSEKGNLHVHMRVHTGEKPFVCQVCSKAFTTNASMLAHMKIHLRKKPARQLASNISSVHNQEKPFVCVLCKKAFAKKKYLNQHFWHTHFPKKDEKPTNRLRFGCRICKTAFPTKGDLIIHMGMHMNPRTSNELLNVRPKDEHLSSEVLNADLNVERDIEQNNDIGEKRKVDVQYSDHVNSDKEVNVDVGRESFVGEKDEVDQEIDVKEHVVEEEPDNGFNGRTICAKFDLEKNIQLIDSENYHACEICNKYFSKTSFLRHKSTHEKEKPFKCETCSKFFLEKDRLDIHMLMHRQEKQFKCHVCLVCHSSFSYKSNLVEHMNSHFPIKPKNLHLLKKPVIGQSWKKSFRRYDDAIKYLKSLTPEINLTENLHLNATQCSGEVDSGDITDEKDMQQDENFAKENEEQGPLLKSSVEKVEVICDESVEVVEVVRQCNERGEDGRKIVKTIEIFSEGVQTADVNCKSIEKMKVVPVHAESIQVAHETVEKIKISEPAAEHTLEKELCGKTSCSEAQMKLYQRQNKNKKPHACHVCNRVFDCELELAAHMQVHTNKKHFACNECDQVYSWRSSLINHMKVHGKESSLCKVCYETFSSKESFREHMKTHTKPKVFTCEICNQSFLERAQLEEHKKMHAVIPVNPVQYVLVGLPIIVINQ